MICKIENCSETKIHGHGMCPKHYRLYWKAANKTPCSVDGCDQFVKARSLCVKHLYRLTANGAVDVTRCAPNGAAIAFIRENVSYSKDECLPWPFAGNRQGYGEAYLDGRKDKAHRIMCFLAHGSPPEEKRVVAHWCGNAWCINPRHLRWATYQENADDNKRLGVKVGRRKQSLT